VVIIFLEEKVEKIYPYHTNLPLSGEKRLFVLLQLPDQGEGFGERNLIITSIMFD
jgi:hypothetical protein